MDKTLEKTNITIVTAKPKTKIKATLPKATVKLLEKQEAKATNPPKDVFSLEVVKEVDKRSKSIRAELGKVESSFLKIAFNLTWFYENESFKALGYDTVYDFAKKEFNISRGTCSNFINVVQRFAVRLEDNTVGNNLLPQYKDFKSSQLIQMLGMSDDEIKQIDKDMSVRDIKKLKKKSDSSSTALGAKFNDGNDSSDCNSDIIDSSCKEVVTNVVLELTKDDLTKGSLNKKHMENLLMSKAQIVLKLLEQGHVVQIVDVVKNPL